MAAPILYGAGDAHLRYIEGRVSSKISARGSRILVRGPLVEQEKLKRVFSDLEALCRQREDITSKDIDTILRLAGIDGSGRNGSPDNRRAEPGEAAIVCEAARSVVKARGANQERFVRMMDEQTVVFAIGPAGTGKTYLAVAKAVDAFQRRQVDKIILVRPVVETGETLGFLPGDILEKVDPYFRPLYDALGEMLTPDRMRRFIDRGLIEIAPLAYMRGRTLNNAFVILDEAQNTTSGQMKMFLTRLGESSRAVLTGDLTQIDLPDPTKSGLHEARTLLQGIKGIGFIEFDAGDVVRHPLVTQILKAYNGQVES
ncbi:MAG: PhoH family protein [Calditrichaeota bacterium]|nr:PhoH family protein [Calditrichota bacterium]